MINPIFIRHFKSEVTFRSFFTVVFIIALILIINLTQTASSNLNSISMTIFIIAVMATYACILKSGNSIAEEHEQLTWDWVRTSSCSAATILFGKLFGPSALYWIVIIICYLLVVIKDLVFNTNSPDLILNYLSLALISISISSLGITVTLLNKSQRRSTGNKPGILFALFSTPLISLAFPGRFTHGDIVGETVWFGTSFISIYFTFFWLTVFTLINLYAAYSAIRCELQSKLLPVGAPLFSLILVLFIGGFVPIHENQYLSDLLIILSIGIILGINYLTILSLSAKWIPLKRFILSLKDKNWRQFLMQMPTWFSMLILSCLAMISGFFLFSDYSLLLVTIAIFNLLIRDLALLLLITFHPKSNFKNLSLVFAVVFILQYLLLPLLFVSLGFNLLFNILIPFNFLDYYRPEEFLKSDESWKLIDLFSLTPSLILTIILIIYSIRTLYKRAQT